MAGAPHTDPALRRLASIRRLLAATDPLGATAALTGPGAGPVRLGPATRRYGRAVLMVLPVWIGARVLVVATLLVANAVVGKVRPGNTGALLRVHQGLLIWDGGWYQSIAGHGYASSGLQSVRFFPAFPMAARALGWVPGVGVGPALVIIANVCALAAMGALVVLVQEDLGDRGLAPSAYSLVLGYADGPLLLCSVVTVLAARTRRWGWAAAAGLAGGLVRPLGILLVVPVLIELWQARRTPASGTRWAARVAAAGAPGLGTGLYLSWVNSEFGDPWLPFRVQQQLGHRGTVTFPLTAMWHNLTSVVHGHHLGSALHIPWVVLSVALLVVAFRRLPLSYATFAASVLVVSLASSNLDSFERYALGAFPLVVAASTLTERRRVEVVVLAVSALGMVGYALLAFLGIVVP